jgi:K+-sensing histidine kinase KdpD
MLNEGLKHSQRVYKGVYEFTNLVKREAVLEKESSNIGDVLHEFLSGTAYLNQVKIETLPTIEVNRSLFCTAIDNLIRNGLSYNDSASKVVRIYMENDSTLAVEDNGRGMSQTEFEQFSQPYARKDGQEESGSGLGLNICAAILEEHGFKISCKKLAVGTKISIKIK